MSTMTRGRVELYRKSIENMFSENNIPTMTVEELKKYDRILYSTFGFHDGEPPHSIISRKLKELKKNHFALWGVAGNIPHEEMMNFCNDTANSPQKDVLMLLKFTDSLKELKKKCLRYSVIDVCKETNGCTKCDDIESWGEEQLLENSHIFKTCIMEGKPLDLIGNNIFVKGGDKQNKAFVIKEIYQFEGLVSYTGVKNCYNNSSGSTLDTRTSLSMLVKKENDNYNLKAGGKPLFAIVFKLKAPDYIVECF